MRFTRRDFIRSAGIATTVALAPGSALVAQDEALPRTLPAPIAKLKSRRAEAVPITVAERQQRFDKARQLMAENKIDAVMLTGGTSLIYFTNIRWFMSERLFALVLPVKGTPFYVCPAFEEDRAREQIAGGPGGTNPELRLWHEDGSPYQRSAGRLKDRDLSPA